MRFCLVIVGAALVIGCGESSSGCSPTDPRCQANLDAANRMAGQWRQVGSPGGINFFIALAAHDTSLVGSGSYTTTSGATGTVSVRGFVFWRDSFPVPSGFEVPAAPSIVLNLTFANRTARLDQANVPGDTLNGALTFSEDPFTTYVVKFGRDRPPL
jgi:hypothetical protein